MCHIVRDVEGYHVILTPRVFFRKGTLTNLSVCTQQVACRHFPHVDPANITFEIPTEFCGSITPSD